MSEARTFRWLSRVEGYSLLCLLFVAMPLKYALGLPLAVRVVGTLHGVLFLALVSAGFSAALERTVTKSKVLQTLAWSVVPFGFLAAERVLRDDVK
jgi:integral membrane protein